MRKPLEKSRFTFFTEYVRSSDWSHLSSSRGRPDMLLPPPPPRSW